MKVILIDPFTRTLSEVEHDGSLESLHNLIGVDIVTAIRASKGNDDALYVDDNGLGRAFQAFFLIDSYDQPLAGRGVVVGDDGEGGDATPETKLFRLKHRIKWLTVPEAEALL